MRENEETKYQGIDTYTKTDHHSYIKENFKVLGNLIQTQISNEKLKTNAKVLDIGCATGALASYFNTRFGNFEILGTDFSQELIEIANQNVSGTKFELNSILEYHESYKERFDLILCMGVLGIFNEAEVKTTIDNMLKYSRKGSIIYAFTHFNEYDLDVELKYKRVDPGNEWSDWASGWNIISCTSIAKILKDRVSSHRFIDFEMPFPISRQENPIRSWTIEMPEGKLMLTNGLKLKIDFKFLEIIV